jgi:hypothetical protein
MNVDVKRTGVIDAGEIRVDGLRRAWVDCRWTAAAKQKYYSNRKSGHPHRAFP